MKQSELNSAVQIFIMFMVICLPFVTVDVTAGTIYVPSDYSTIQAAIDAASGGDEVLVAQGSYYENIAMKGKNITLRSLDPDDPLVVENTVIDGDENGAVVTFSGTEVATCVIDGFTLTRGYEVSGGGGIDGQGTLATISNNIIKDNSSYDSGAGIVSCDGVIENNTITNNTSYNYNCGGLYACDGHIRNNNIARNEGQTGGLSYCDGIIEHNIISHNTGYFGGIYECEALILENQITHNTGYDVGGISGYYMSGCYGDIRRNVISGNVSSNGIGGIYKYHGVIDNNIVAFNQGDSSGGIASCLTTVSNCLIFGNTSTSGYGAVDDVSQLVNSIVWGNEGEQIENIGRISYCCIQYWVWGGTGNISSYPQFVDLFNGDLHLQDASPCIDAGNPSPEFNDACRPPGKGTERSDMGVYGGAGNRGYVPPLCMQMARYTFLNDEQGWTFAGTIPPYDLPTSIVELHHIGLSPNGSSDCFSYWESPSIYIGDGEYYRVRWLMKSDCYDYDGSVQFRLRVNQEGAWQAWNRIVTSNNRQAPSGGYGTWYEVFLTPESTAPIDESLILNFDIMSFAWDNDTNSWLYLDSFYLEEIVLIP